MPLKDIFCQEKAIDALQLAYIGDKVAHAYIFAGPDGVGKFTTAKEFAKLLLCESPIFTAEHAEKTSNIEHRTFNVEHSKSGVESSNKVVSAGNGFVDSCGKCDSCRAFDAGSHFDFEHVYKELLEFTRDGKDKNPPLEFPIDVVREFVIEKVKNRPALSKKRVFVLTEAEKLNIESQNCLLKVLEEPPGYCCIILICTKPERLLPTIRSRCQILRFGPVAEDKIIKKLNELGLNERQAKYFARFSAGSLGLACTYAQLEKAEVDDESDVAGLYQTKTELLNTFADLQYKDSIELAEDLIRRSKSLAKVWSSIEPATSATDIKRKAHRTVIQILISALNDVMLASVNKEQNVINFDQPQQLRKLAQRFDAEQAALKIADCFKTLNWLESAVNEKLIFETLLLNLAETDRITV
jgi:DNA polymerase-3 subunit delta'